jgi:hypothetical protein
MSPNELPINEWVVIFYPQTGATRLCPTLDFAKNVLTSRASFASNVYKSPKDFRTRYDHAFLENCWRAAYRHASWVLPKTATGTLDKYEATPPDTDTETFCNLLWEFLQDVGDRLTQPRINTDKSKEHYEIKLEAMYQLIDAEKDFKNKYNNQARTVFEALYHNGQQFLDETQIKKLIFELVADRALKTKQKPWVIFQYYRPQFIKDGYIVRGRQPRNRGKE